MKLYGLKTTDRTAVVYDKSKVEVYNNRECECTFNCNNMYLVHDHEDYNFRPYLKMEGSITDINADLPYGVSSIYFAEQDGIDVEYYYTFSNKELMLLVKNGYFNGPFDIPDYVREASYTNVPVLCNFTMIAPDKTSDIPVTFVDISDSYQLQVTGDMFGYNMARELVRAKDIEGLSFDEPENELQVRRLPEYRLFKEPEQTVTPSVYSDYTPVVYDRELMEIENEEDVLDDAHYGYENNFDDVEYDSYELEKAKVNTRLASVFESIDKDVSKKFNLPSTQTNEIIGNLSDSINEKIDKEINKEKTELETLINSVHVEQPIIEDTEKKEYDPLLENVDNDSDFDDEDDDYVDYSDDIEPGF